ncbi:MAG: hypothetical protein GXY47_15325 [Acidobacteria bacterium]|nr:hypothetical protein [Acidobacteriota bacterium]
MKSPVSTARIVLFALMAALLAVPSSPLLAQGALDQLEDGTNTGTLFDGSDGSRFGTDTGIGGSSGDIPDVPEPTPVDTPDDGADQGGADDSGGDNSGRDGEEPAE